MTPKNLKKLRLELGLTQGACADGMRVSRQTIINLEDGKIKRPATLQYYELFLKAIKRAREDREAYREAHKVVMFDELHADIEKEKRNGHTSSRG